MSFAFKPQLHETGMLVTLNCSFSWGSITDKQITQETNDLKGSIAGSCRTRKTLLPAASGVHVKLVQSTLNLFKGYHDQRTFSIGIEGTRVLLTPYYMEYEEKFGETAKASSDALQILKDNFPQSVREARNLLGSAFNQDDYPDVEDIDRYYKFKHKYMGLPDTNKIMQTMGTSIAAQVNKSMEEMLEAMAKDAKMRLMKAVERVQEQCSNPKGKIYDSLTGSIGDLITSIPEIAGLTADPALDLLLKEVRSNLGGIKAEDIRESQGARSEAALAAAAIIKRMGGK